MYKFELSKNLPYLSVLTAAYNEESSIKETIYSIQNSDYPKKLLEIIVINDGSTDKTLQIIRKIKGIKIINKANSGKADSLNQALKIAKGKIVAIIDADSFPDKDAFKKMVSYFKNKEVGAVTSTILVKNKNNLLGKLQNIEYMMIAYGRKLLEYLDAVFVTPGALSMYRKKALLKIGGFDKNNLTEDIEIAWHLLSKKYKIKMCFAAKAYTIVPDKFKKWWRQRLRWDIGGFQTLYKYKYTALRRNYSTLGTFVVPFFGSYVLLSFIGFFISVIVMSRRFIFETFKTYDIISNNSPILRLDNLYFTPNVFTFFGIFLFGVFLIYTIFGIKTIYKEKMSLNYKFNILAYLLIYLVLSPLILIHSVYRLSIGKLQW